VFQLWKQDVPWAKAGTVTVALGGDIAKDAGVLPDQAALEPGTPDDIASGVVTPQIQWATHTDGEKTFKYPADWQAGTFDGGLNTYYSKDMKAAFFYAAPFNMGPSFNQQDFITSLAKSVASDPSLALTSRQSTTINGYPADFQYYNTAHTTGVIVTIKKGGQIHVIVVDWTNDKASTYQPILMAMIQSYSPQ
jgi:hypothetical protein